MAKPPNPFAGMALSDQTSLRQPAPDQRLFGRSSAAPAEPPTVAPRPRSPKVSTKKPRPDSTTVDQQRNTTTDTTPPGNRDTTVSWLQGDWVTGVARLLRRPGKESA